jgi:hypothetical protein
VASLDLLDIDKWTRPSDNLIEQGPYSIQRVKTTTRTRYFLWRDVPANGRSYPALLGAWDSAERAREEANKDYVETKR